VIENTNQYQVNPDVSLGSSKWLGLYRYNQQENNTRAAIDALRENDYRIVATTPGEKAMNLEELNIYQGKIALFFGTELTGLSDMVLDEADESVKIPMMGFTESFNISVSVAIILHFLSYTLRKSDISWELADIEKDDILLSWLKNSIKKSGLLIEKFLSENKMS
jgi:tRNA (guanosine-2'-O-)-methyltransferase